NSTALGTLAAHAERVNLHIFRVPDGVLKVLAMVGFEQLLPPHADLTVAQNVSCFAKILGAPTADVDRVIGAVGLTGREGDRVGRLSGGQRSRVSLAVALLGTPEVLVLDEPTVGLDPVLRRDVWQLFGELAQTGLTLVVSSHVMDEASRCDDLMLLRDGDLLANDTVSAILEATGTSDIEAAFLRLVEGKS
ncbi:MAG: ABC transporter ATP-binding protein, partial [Actinomycetia bacterium]|nr:ABC transporter ATP-binding protein [Actinomycetes bacterium]